MGKIENFNCEGMCQEEHCSEKYTHIFWQKINNITYGVLLCEKCYDRLVDGVLEDLR